jgi:hypothetical protein
MIDAMKSRRLVSGIVVGIGVAVAAPSAQAAITFTQPANTVTTSKLELDFANNTFEPERVDSARWRDSGGTLGPNLVANSSLGSGCNGAGSREHWGQAYGDTDGATPNPVVSGSVGVWSPLSNRTLEINDSTSTTCTGTSVVTPVRTRYSFFDQGAAASMIRVERRFGFTASDPTYNGVGLRAYTPRLPAGTYGQVVHPNEAGTALVTDNLGCNGGCGTGATDDNWNGTWLAFNSGANAGLLVLRDPANATGVNGVRLVRDSDGNSGSNNSGVSLLRTPTNQKQPLTEVEYLCFYDSTTWPVAERSVTRLPDGCAAKPVPINTALPTVSGNAGDPRPGDTVTALDGSWDNAASFSYQWSRCSGGVCSPIFGATDRNYTATLDDFGQRLRVTVTATAPGGETDSADSTFAGTITGHVYVGGSSPGNRLAGAPVQACEVGATVCRTALTDGDGAYRLQVPRSAAWTLTAFPPAGSNAIRATRAAPTNVVDGQESAGQDLILAVPGPPPSNVGFQGSGYRSTTSAGVPVFHWQEPVVVRYRVPKPGYTVDGSIEYPGQDPIPLYPGPFVPDPSPACSTCGYFEFPVPPQHPNHGPGNMHFHPTPPDGPPNPPDDPNNPPDDPDNPDDPNNPPDDPNNPPDDPDDPNAPPGDGDFPIYIDPSGFVRTTDGAPIVGARVTLYRSDLPGGEKQVVEDGSAVMSPMNRKNTDVTDAGGHFGWDVIAGYYKVRVEADGCFAPGNPGQSFVDTDEMEIPPPVTNLDIRLECPRPKGALKLPAKAKKIKVDKKGKFKIAGSAVDCPPDARSDCTATIDVTAKKPKKGKKALKLGSSTMPVGVGKSATIAGKLSKKGAKLVKKAKKLKKATVAIAVEVPGGDAVTGSLKATLVAR